MMTNDTSRTGASPATADFGFTRVAQHEKQAKVNAVFAKVAERYDQMNDLMSGGLHRLWKDDFITLLNPPRGNTRFAVLDMAGGTGDIAQRIAMRSGNGTHVTVADISPEMLGEGRRRLSAAGLDRKCTFSVANAESLPFPDKSFSAYTIAFGIRNVTRIEAALAEAYRVLRPGGRFMCLEFSAMAIPGLDKLYDAYSFTVIPAVGKAVTGDGGPYRYLVESIRKFPDQVRFAALIEAAGFEHVQYRNLSGGVAAIHSGRRI